MESITETVNDNKKEKEKEKIRTDKIMIILGRRNPKNHKMSNELEKNYRLIKDLDVLMIRENKGQNRSEKILDLIEREVTVKRDLIFGGGTEQ